MSASLSRVPLWLWAVWFVMAAVLLYRAGLYPAAMTGDEIWFSESAYHLLVDGVPRRAIHSDAHGSAVADFLPPMVMLAQAASFALFGLSAFAIGFPSAAVCLGASLLMYAAAKNWGVPTRAAGLAALALLGSQLFLRAGLYIRYEGMVIVCFLGFLALSGKPGGPARQGLRGGLLCLAGLSYYPTAPFVGLAGLWVEVWRWRSGSGGGRDLLPALGGFALPALGFGAYVLSFPTEFAAQVLFNGSSNYLTFELPRHLLDVGFWRSSLIALPEVLALLALAGVVLLSWRREDAAGRCLWGIALILAVPALIFPFQPRLLGGTMAVSLITLARWSLCGGWSARLAWVGVAGGSAVALLLAVLMVMTVRVQGAGRDGAGFTEVVNSLMIAPGAVGIDQRAWLAVHLSQPEREIHHVMPSWAPPQVSVFESEILKQPQGGDSFSYLILDRATAEGSIARSPALAAAVGSGKLVPIARIDGSVPPLPWAKTPPFDLIVYGPAQQGK